MKKKEHLKFLICSQVKQLYMHCEVAYEFESVCIRNLLSRRKVDPECIIPGNEHVSSGNIMNLNNGKLKNTLSIKEMFVFSFQYGQLTEGRTYYKNALSETTSDLSYLISNFFPKTGEFELLQTPRICLAYISVLSFNLFLEPSLHILTLNIHINHQRIFSAWAYLINEMSF